MEYDVLVVEVHLPGQRPFNFGVLLVDPVVNQLHARFASDLSLVTGEDVEVIREMPTLLTSMAAESGASGLFAHLEDTASNVIRVGDRRIVVAEDPVSAVSRAYAAYVAIP